MDTELKDTICGKKDQTMNSTTTAQTLIGNPSSAMNSIQTTRLNNSSDKLSQLINLGRDFNSGEEIQEGCNNAINQKSETTSVNRRYNFNNRDMELSLAGSDEEDEEDDDDDDEDEDDQVDEEMMHHHHQQQQQDQQQHDGDYGDIQFFHHKLLLQQHLGQNDFGIGSSVSSFGSPNGLVNLRGGGSSGGVDSFHIEECDDNGLGNSFSENPFVFPDNVMEYGEPQFFPGNCVGYLETILEETDEEFEEEEGCSGRHWWTADSDTDTDSVIRVDNGQQKLHPHNQFNNPNHSTVQSTGTTNLKAVDNMEDLSVQSTFRSSASSRPFELEDLHLLDQLDLAFEETLMEPRRRSGFAAFGHQLHLLDQPLETNKQGLRGNNLQGSPFGLMDDDRLRPSGERSAVLQRSSSLDGDRSSKVFSLENVESHSKKESELISYGGEESKNEEAKKLGNAESKETFGSSLSPSSSDSEPHEVAEEDFFYSSPGSESEEGSSCSDDSEKAGGGGVVLAEFSLSQGLSSSNSGNLFGSAKNRRSFESPLSSSKLKSFRSFDSLNSLSGTELLFSKADTFPSFHYIKEDVEPGSSGSGSPSSPRCNLNNLSSSSANDVTGASGSGRREATGAGGVDDRRDCCTAECEDESQSLPSHHAVGFPPTFSKITKKNSYSSSSTSTASSCNSASGMMSTENLSEDSGIGPDGAPTIHNHHPSLVGKGSSESFTDEGPKDAGESAKDEDFIAKTEFALNPMVFSSLSSNDTYSNSPSMNSIPSLNTQGEESSDLVLSDPENPDLFGEGKGDYYCDKLNPSTYPSGVLNIDTTISHNSLSDSHLREVEEEDDESASRQDGNCHEKGSNQIPDNPLEPQCPIPINNNPATIAPVNDDPPPPIQPTKEVTSLHPASNLQIESKPSIITSAPDDAPDEAKSPGEDNNKSLDKLGDKPKPNNPTVEASMELLGEKANAINTNVPLHSSSPQLPSTLALPSAHCDTEPQNQQISPEIASPVSYSSQPDVVRLEPGTTTIYTEEYLPKALDDSFVNRNVNEERSIIVGLSSQKSQNQHPGVGVPSGVVPYIEANEMQEDLLEIGVRDKDGWNVNATSSVEGQLSDSPPPSPSLISHQDLLEEFEEDPSDYGHTPSGTLGEGYQYPYQLDEPYRRERSNSESEFESAESAVEEDSIALAYAIVNSPTKGSASSSPTQELNGTSMVNSVNNLVSNVDSNTESGPVSTLMGLALIACEGDDCNGMQAEERVVETTCAELFASPSGVCGTGQDGLFNRDGCELTGGLVVDEGGMKSASHLLLHHHHEEVHYHSNTNPIISPASTITYQEREEEAVVLGHELLASRSVTLDKSSSADVVHHIKQVQDEPQQEPRVDKHNLESQAQVGYQNEEEDEPGLITAKPIDPVHIGVAEVKKFTQLDSSVSRNNKTHPHLPYQTLGESESESRPAPTGSINPIPQPKPSNEAILGHSNFGFFGRSSCSGSSGAGGSVVGSRSSSIPPHPSIVNLDPKSGSFSTTTTESSSSESSSSYGFPSPCPYPISETDLHSSESVRGEDWKEIRSSGANSRRSERSSRDQPKDQQRLLHLEDIKCGIHPDNFTIPLGAYTAAVCAVAPSIPSTRLLFLNEGEPRIHEESSILKEKIGTGSRKSSSTTNTSSNNKKANPKPTNGPGTACPSHSVPDILVVKKQTEKLQGSEESDKKEGKAYTNPTCGDSSRMEVDTASNAPVGGGVDRRSRSPSGIPIKTRTYGARNEVEVVLVSSRTPSPAPVSGVVGSGGGNFFPTTSSLRQHKPSTSSSLGEEGNKEDNGSSSDPPAKIPRTRVHFSPVVSEISWRESYIDQSSEFSGSTEDLNAKLGEVNQGDCIKSGATTIAGRDNGGYHPLTPSNVSVSDSIVRPLHFDQMSHYHASGEPVLRQSSPASSGGGGKGPILVEKVQMRSSFLQGGDDDEEDDELERKLTMDIHIADNRCKSPVDEDYGENELAIENSHKENVEFRSGAPSGSARKGENGNGILDLYEDVNVEIEQINKKSTTLSMVPDLLSQCENANNAQTQIDVRIDEVGFDRSTGRAFRNSHSTPLPGSEIPPPPPVIGMEPQQQIFPKIFAEDGKGGKNDSKNNSSSSLNKTKKTSKVFSLGSSGSKKAGENPKDKDNKETNGTRETEASKENKIKANKPGFFERLSKIRLSGSKAKKQQRVHPKTDELSGGQPLRTINTVNLNGNSNTNGASTGSNIPGQAKPPILKKAPANSPTPVLLNYSVNDVDSEPEANESHEAFENILDEIAGIKKIQMRMEKQSSNGSNGSGPGSPDKPSPPVKELRSFAKRKQFYSESGSPSPPVSPNGRSYSDLDKKLSQFREETSKTRDAVSKSHPDLELIEDSVRQHSASPEPPKKVEEANKSSPEPKKSPKKSSSNSETGQKNEREWYKLLKSAAERYYYRGSKDDNKQEKPSSTASGKTGIVETDLDTGASREMLDGEIEELDRIPSYTVSTSEIPSAYTSTPISSTTMSPGTAAKARSLTNLSTRLPLSIAPSNYDDDDPLAQGDHNDFDERARSYEFLLDDNQKSSSVPPENKLRLESRQLSEHELRIQRSLQRINVPEWFKNHDTSSRTGSPANESTSTNDKAALKLLRRSEYGSSGGLAGGWAGLSAFKAPSMSSLQSSNGGRYSGSLNRSNFIRGRPATMSATRLSKESLAGTGSASHSPSAYDRCSFTYGMPYAMTRFGHGRMSNHSGSVTPTSTPDSSLPPTAGSAYVKKPYLGWRSQERLNAAGTGGPPKLSVYLPPEERLAAELLKTKMTIRPPISDRPPLPKPPPRSEKTALTKTASIDNQRATSPSVTATNNSSVAFVTKINQTNSIPPPNFSDDEQSSSACREKTSDVHDSIREVTKAISQYVAKGEEETPKPQPRKKSGKKSIWMESSFVGRKPVSK